MNLMNDDSLGFFKDNIKSNNIHSTNYLPKQDYEDPFTKKLNLKSNISSSVRKENATESRINDMIASLFPEQSNRNNSKINRPVSSINNDQNTLLPSSSASNVIFEKNKFNNFEKMRYILKENKLKSSKKNNK